MLCIRDECCIVDGASLNKEGGGEMCGVGVSVVSPCLCRVTISGIGMSGIDIRDRLCDVGGQGEWG